MAGKQDILAGSAFVRIFLKDDLTGAIQGAMSRAGSSISSVGKSIATAGAGISAVGAGMLAPIIAGVQAFAATGDQLDKMSQRTGIAASELAAYGFAAEQSGASLETVEVAVRKMQRSIGDLTEGTATMEQAFDSIGLSLTDIQGLSPEKQFDLISERIGAIQDPTLKASAAMEIFGRSGTMMLPMLGSLKDLKQEARDLGIVPGEEEVKKAAAVTDAINRVKRVLGAMFFDIGAAVADDVLAALDAVKRIGVAIGGWIKQNAGIIKTVAAIGVGLVVFGGAITAAGLGIVAIGTALSGLGAAIGVVGTILGALVSPVGLVVAAVAIGIAAWVRYTESGQAALAGLFTAFDRIAGIAKETFGGIFDAIASGDLALAGEIALTGLELVARAGLDTLAAMFGETFGQIGNQLIGGDFAGAWATATDAALQVWYDFKTAVLETFAGVVVGVVKMWTDLQNKISNKIIEWSMDDGPMGAAARAMLGVDLRGMEDKGANRQQKAMEFQLEVQRRQRDEAAAAGDTAGAAGWDAEIAKTLDRLSSGIAPTVFDAAAESRKILDEMTAGTQDSLISGPLAAAAEARRAAQELERARGVAATEGTAEANARVAELEARLTALRDRAATAKTSTAAAAAAGGDTPAGDDVAALAATPRGVGNIATFSAAAAQAAGFGGAGGPQERMANGIERIAKLSEALAADANRQVRQMEELTLGMTHG